MLKEIRRMGSFLFQSPSFDDVSIVYSRRELGSKGFLNPYSCEFTSWAYLFHVMNFSFSQNSVFDEEHSGYFLYYTHFEDLHHSYGRLKFWFIAFSLVGSLTYFGSSGPSSYLDEVPCSRCTCQLHIWSSILPLLSQGSLFLFLPFIVFKFYFMPTMRALYVISVG